MFNNDQEGSYSKKRLSKDLKFWASNFFLFSPLFRFTGFLETKNEKKLFKKYILFDKLTIFRNKRD